MDVSLLENCLLGWQKLTGPRLVFLFTIGIFLCQERHHPELFSLVQSSTRQWMDKLFMSNGFRVNMISHEEVARGLGKVLAPANYKNILFVAEQLRFSDDQVRN